MKLCRVQYCDFVAWWEGDEIFHQRISLDSSFIDNAIESFTPFIKFAVLPELVWMWFSKQSVMPLSQSSDVSRNDTDDASSSSNLTGYCYCGRGEDYDGCNNKDCSIEQFHYSCLKITAKDVATKAKLFLSWMLCTESQKGKDKNE